MPPGGVHVAALLNAKNVMTIVFEVVVVTLDVECDVLLPVFWPPFTFTGVVVFTFEKVMMPPAAPADVENDHV